MAWRNGEEDSSRKLQNMITRVVDQVMDDICTKANFPTRNINEDTVRRMALEALEANPKFRQLQQRVQDEAQDRVARDVANQAKADGAGCFPPNATVQLDNGASVSMANLRVGQNILSSLSNGKAEYSTVYFFAHQDDAYATEFTSILTPRHNIKLTPDHHIFIIAGCCPYTVPARKVQVGDKIMVVNREKSCLEEEIVTAVATSAEVGIYAPITMSGTIIVNNVLASCYVDVVPPNIAHPLLWPARQLYQLAPSLSAVTNIHGKDGMPKWVKWFMDNVLN